MYLMIHSQKHVNLAFEFEFRFYYIFSYFFPSVSFKMPSVKTNRVEPRAFRKPNVRASDALLRAPTRKRERERKRARCHDNAACGSHLGCERGRVSESERERPCSGHAAAGELNSTLTCCGGCCEVLWRDWNIGTRDAARPGLAVSQCVRRVAACVRSYDGCGDCWTIAPACARTATSGDKGMASMAAVAAATAAEAA